MKEAEVDENDENNEADAEDEPKGVKSPQKSKKKRKLKKSKGFHGTSYPFIYWVSKVSVQGVIALGSHFAALCQEVDFHEAFFFIVNFQKENANNFTLLTFRYKND